MIAKFSSGTLMATLLATAAVAAPLRPSMVLPGQSVPGQASTGPNAAGQQQAAQQGQGVPEPARPRVRRGSSFFGLPLALLAAGAGAGAVAAVTASPQ